jgi:hypothetical protein
VGAGLLAEFRLTFADNGRVLWVEQRSESTGPSDVDVPSLLPPIDDGGNILDGTNLGGEEPAREIPALPKKD